jgi:CO/xanthine dehydrogenase FAD-binding subunit
MKVRRRGSFDFPVLGVGAWVAFDGPVDRPGAVVADVRLRLGGVGSYPVAADEARAALVGKPLTEDAIREAADLAARPSRPLDNTDFAMGWRKQVTRVYVARALRAIAAGSPGGSSDKFDGVPGLGSALPMAGPA